MPSDLAKKKAAKKKEAAKARSQKKKPEEVNGEGENPEEQQNGTSNGGEHLVKFYASGNLRLNLGIQI